MSDKLRQYYLDTFGIRYTPIYENLKELFEPGSEYGTYLNTDTKETQLYHFSSLEIEKAEKLHGELC